MLIVALGWSSLEAIRKRQSTLWKTPSVENLQSTHSSKMYIHTIGGHSTSPNKQTKKKVEQIVQSWKDVVHWNDSQTKLVGWKISGCYVEPQRSPCVKWENSIFFDKRNLLQCDCSDRRRDDGDDGLLTCRPLHQQAEFCSVSLATNLTW